MLKQIIKRDGKVVKYNRNKIKNAIQAAEQETKENIENINSLINKIEDVIDNKFNNNLPTVEQIQDIVEEKLMEYNYNKIAKRYILYREERKKARKQWVSDGLPLSIWERKYQFRDETFEEFFDRISGGNEKIRKIIKNKEFLPAGRILANRGLSKYGKKVTYSNCYVTSPPKDNLESIVNKAKELARTYSFGGGSGLDLSNLRPAGANVNNAAQTTSGAPSFMGLYDEISKIIGMKGRRAALMLSLDVNHPDIEEFIEKKLDLDSITKANISVKVDDKFMKAVKNNKKYKLKFYVEDTGEEIEREIEASKLMNKLAYGNWFSSEPGVLFWDRIKEYSLMDKYDDFIYAGTNPLT